MKAILLSVTTAMLFSLSFPAEIKGQVNVGIHINTGSQPDWGPRGYDYVEYYYLPDIACYYYVPRHQFVYLSGGNWVFSANLPYAYRHYDLYRGYKVVVNEPRAYRYYGRHKIKYGHKKYYHQHANGYRGGHGHGGHRHH